eukprot:TCONS_00006758-protein
MNFLIFVVLSHTFLLCQGLPNITITVPENSVLDFFLAQLNPGPNATYALQNFKDKFYINDNNQLLTNGILDFETKTFYELSIKVEPDQSESFFVKVRVTDVNDNRPVFTQNTYSFETVFDTSPSAQSIRIGEVRATDMDASSDFRVINYEILPSNSVFYLQSPTTPVIYAQAGQIQLNGERSRVYEITLSARDIPKEFNVLTTAKIQIQMTSSASPITTNPPTQPDFKVAWVYTTFSIPESSPYDFQITPANPNFRTHYQLKASSDQDAFAINEKGALVLRRKLDYEKTQRIELTFTNKTNLDSISIYNYIMVLDITDVNDNPPTLKVSPVFPRITTNFPKGSLVSHVGVQDLDSVSKTFTFSINNGDPKKLFTIDDQGSIYTTQCLGTDAVGQYRLGIRVKDGVFIANKTLMVQIHKASDKDFDNNCGLECNPITFSVTSTANGDVTFTNVEQNGQILNQTQLQTIVGDPQSTEYSDLSNGIQTSLVEFFERKYSLVRLNVTNMTIVDQLQKRQRRSADPEAFLSAQYIFEVKTTDATLQELNPISQNETIEFTKSSKYRLQTNDQLSVVSDVDECQTNLDQCDVNAYCMIYPNVISYTCQCKDQYEGDGFECNKIVDKVDKNLMIAIGVSIGGGVLLIIVVVLVVVYCKNKSRYLRDLKRLNANTQAGMPLTKK